MSESGNDQQPSVAATRSEQAAMAQRYERQIRFAPWGQAGQDRLARAKVLLVGCGALGSVIANTLVRAGVGYLKLVDRDYLEWNNLQRQVLYDEEDVRRGWPKAMAAAKRLRQINSQVEIEPLAIDFEYRNARQLADQCDLILDGTDNFETRFLMNDLAWETGTPWVYGGCVGAEGQSMTIVPGQSACLRCLMLDGPPPPGTTPSCDSAGILAPIVNVIASLQASEGLKVLSGNLEQVSRQLTIVDLWTSRIRQMSLEGLAQRVNCPTCQQGKREWLSGEHGMDSAVLCGRQAVQIRSAEPMDLDFAAIRSRLDGVGQVEMNEFLLRFTYEEFKITLFEDGRAIVHGTDDIAKAKSLYARWIGG